MAIYQAWFIVLAVVVLSTRAQQTVVSQSIAIATSTSVNTPVQPSPKWPSCPASCNDSPPPAAKNATKFTCEEQKDFKKCDVDFMLGFCECTCDRCCPCNNYPPTNQTMTCKQLKKAGKCNKDFMAGYCMCECNLCTEESEDVTGMTYGDCDVGLFPVQELGTCETARCATNRQRCADSCGGLAKIDFECKDSGAAFSSSCACAGK
eukprot:TRINITY_DN575_c0_g1_i1.p1 TRINITY_DN575_c0_g1~~TRINITY_DN575_c0_g1_i1.p1  ORF type:complete len:206 (-),score=18.28 TRINITY_DN575_c0_g1_i1:278-895(-)